MMPTNTCRVIPYPRRAPVRGAHAGYRPTKNARLEVRTNKRVYSLSILMPRLM